MAQTKQTAWKNTGGKPLAMGRGKATPKKNPTPGGRADRKVVLEYSSDETPDESAPKPAEGAQAPKRVKKQIHLTLPTSPAHVTTTETFATFFINHGLMRVLQKAFAKRGWSTDQMREFVTNLLRYRSRYQDDIFPRIELIPSFVLSSDNTNCKNDIQLFHQLFDELSVHTDYH